tara:strand:+ start:2894 stop:3790 length:897 start_codon:yes stop_codon:yes gene_type:complete
MADMTLFNGNSMVSSDLFKSLQGMNDNLTGGSASTTRRISIKGGRFRMMVNGEQVSVSKSNELNVVVVNAAKISRTYYGGAYDPEKTTAPSCWSADTQKPAPEVDPENRQATTCATCPMNIKGSGQGDSRACRFSQRLAITLEGKPDEVYQLQLPATSIFGEAKGNNMGMQAYARFLQAHNTPHIAVVTEMRFDENSETPKLHFKPIRGLEEEELIAAVAARDSEDAKKAVTMTVSKAASKFDGAVKPKAISEMPKDTIDIVDSTDEIEEPKKVVKKATPEGKPAANLDAIVSGWDDE